MDKELRILILEDVDADAELMEKELQRGGLLFSAKQVKTREGFLEQLRDFPPDLILADYELPQFNGMAALELAKEYVPTVPLIILTDLINAEASVECIREGAANYVIKTHLIRLGSVVKSALEMKRIREEKAQAEEALLTSAREWRATFDAVNDAIVLMDLERKVLRCNKAMENLLGRPFSEIIGRTFCELLHGFSEPVRGCPALRMQETCRRETMDLSLGDRWFNIVVDPLNDERGCLIGVVHILSDITEQKRVEKEKVILEEQLRQSQKMEAVGRLAGGIAHDFNNLLTIIKGYSQLVLLGLQEGDPLRENTEEIQRATEQATDLIRQLLAFSRRQVMEMRVLDLNIIIQNLEKMLHRILGEDIEMVTHLTADLGRTKVDPGQIEQVIMNLVVNARDAMPSVGKLTIETTNVDLNEEYIHTHIGVAPGHYVMLEVSDTGVGMTPEVKERIFEPFYTTKEKGTGLGLSTVYGIVRQCSGTIWVYSELNKGTIFKIYLPRVEEPLEEMGEKRVLKDFPHGQETVLVVEDYEEVRKLAVRILSKQGYKVLEAADGSDALQLCEKRKGPIHLIVTDMVMPGMSGIELTERLIVMYPEIRVLYMSGYTDSRTILGADDANYIQKPFTVEGLARKVKDVLEKNADGLKFLQTFDIQYQS
jgi:PAS domain S-box-containing protein